MEEKENNKQTGREAIRINWGAANTYLYQVNGFVTDKQEEDKLEKFKERIEPFKNVSTLEEAKALAEKILPVKLNISRFRIGSAECIIINKPNQFRICLQSDSEFISYDFA